MGRLQGNRKVREDQPDWWSSDEWETPPEFIATIEAKYGKFDLDPCCRPATAKAPKFYTKADDGLSKPWDGLVWVNPPYSQPTPWIKKAIAETTRSTSCFVIMLLPADTSTVWFHDLVIPYSEFDLLRGRLRFLLWDGSLAGSPKGGSVLAFFPKGWK